LASWEGALSWEGAAIDVDPQRAAKWIADGEDALEIPQTVQKQQRAPAALLRPIARISLYGPLEDLAEALNVLPLGVVHRIVTLSPKKKLHGYKEGLKIWRARKLALEWAEFQYRAKRMSKTEAKGEVASAFGIGEDSVDDWKGKVKVLFGMARVKEGLDWAAKMGCLCRSIRDELAIGNVKKSAAVKNLEEYFESEYGKQKLEVFARIYKARKRRSGK
jgi:hypothetical protein